MCPLCKGINSQYCYRCRGNLLVNGLSAEVVGARVYGVLLESLTP